MTNTCTISIIGTTELYVPLSFFGKLVILSQQYHLIFKAWNLHAISPTSLAATKKVRVRKNSHLIRSSSCSRKKEKLPARVAKCIVFSSPPKKESHV